MRRKTATDARRWTPIRRRELNAKAQRREAAIKNHSRWDKAGRGLALWCEGHSRTAKSRPIASRWDLRIRSGGKSALVAENHRPELSESWKSKRVRMQRETPQHRLDIPLRNNPRPASQKLDVIDRRPGEGVADQQTAERCTHQTSRHRLAGRAKGV